VAGNYSSADLADFYKSRGVIHINRQNGFVVRGMRVSPVYIDGMSIATSVDGLRMVSDLMFQKLSSETFDVVAAPSISGIPYASILANRFEKRLVIDRGLPSKHGMRRRIEGEVRAGDKIVIVDDISKRGHTLLDMSEELVKLGAEVVLALVTVDATSIQEKALLNGAKIKFASLIDLGQLNVSPNIKLDESTQP
jgi:orotate phosphoribosyltransferase